MIDLDVMSQHSMLLFLGGLLLTQFVVEAVKYFVASFRAAPVSIADRNSESVLEVLDEQSKTNTQILLYLKEQQVLLNQLVKKL